MKYIEVSSLKSMIDSPIKIRIVGLQPEELIELKASRIATGTKKLYLGSSAKFIANKEGIVDLTKHAPISGTYIGVDGMGLFWSLEIMDIGEDIESSNNNEQLLAPQIITLSLLINDLIVEEIMITREWKSDKIARYPIRENGLVATFFCHTQEEPKPGIIIVGGSEGGIYEYPATLLASHGFSVLALAYFGVEHLPKRLVDIPLEYVKTAIEWLKNRPEVNANWLGIHGTSRGGELALLSASLFPDIKAAVALNGFAVSFSGIVPWSTNESLPPAWTYEGRALPYASPINPVEVAVKCQEMWERRAGNPFGEWYDALVKDVDITEKAEIPVEKINGPVLFITGEEDAADTVGLCQRGMARLEKHKSPFTYTHLIYPGAGHSIGIPYVMMSHQQGNKKDTAFASLDSWKKTIEFFNNSYVNVIKGALH